LTVLINIFCRQYVSIEEGKMTVNASKMRRGYE
jgi:hypothetical protein